MQSFRTSVLQGREHVRLAPKKAPPEPDPEPRLTWRCAACGYAGNFTHHPSCSRCGETKPPLPKRKP